MPEFYTPLHVCAAAPFPLLLEHLLNDGEIYSADIFGKTPLTYAMESDSKPCVQVIINHFRTRPSMLEVSTDDIAMILRKNLKLATELFRFAFFDLNEGVKRGVLDAPQKLITGRSFILKQDEQALHRLGTDRPEEEQREL